MTKLRLAWKIFKRARYLAYRIAAKKCVCGDSGGTCHRDPRPGEWYAGLCEGCASNAVCLRETIRFALGFID